MAGRSRSLWRRVRGARASASARSRRRVRRGAGRWWRIFVQITRRAVRPSWPAGSSRMVASPTSGDRDADLLAAGTVALALRARVHRPQCRREARTDRVVAALARRHRDAARGRGRLQRRLEPDVPERPRRQGALRGRAAGVRRREGARAQPRIQRPVRHRLRPAVQGWLCRPRVHERRADPRRTEGHREGDGRDVSRLAPVHRRDRVRLADRGRDQVPRQRRFAVEAPARRALAGGVSGADADPQARARALGWLRQLHRAPVRDGGLSAMRTVAIVQARLGSSRLPGKVLQDLAGDTMLARVVARLRAARTLDDIVIATTLSPSDGPLLDSDTVDRVVTALRAAAVDYSSNTHVRTYPRGLDVEAFYLDPLERILRSATSSAAKEHVTAYVMEKPNEFAIHQVTAEADDSDLRWTVDTAEDLALLRAKYGELGLATLRPYREVVAAERARPELAVHHAHITQKNWQDSHVA